MHTRGARRSPAGGRRRCELAFDSSDVLAAVASDPPAAAAAEPAGESDLNVVGFALPTLEEVRCGALPGCADGLCRRASTGAAAFSVAVGPELLRLCGRKRATRA